MYRHAWAQPCAWERFPSRRELRGHEPGPPMGKESGFGERAAEPLHLQRAFVEEKEQLAV